MKSDTARYASIDAYIATFPPATQELLEAVRATIRAAAPDAQEKIAYRMPTFTLHGNLVHFAAVRDGIALYPTSSGVNAFKEELAGYISTPGSVRFPFGQPLPLDLIARIVRFRADENRARVAAKTTARAK